MGRVHKIYGIIYLLTNRVNNKKYIGQTTQMIEDRWKGHLGKAKNKPVLVIDFAIRKYGKENFTLKLVRNCYWRCSNKVSQESLNRWEDYYIKKLKTKINQWGYNVKDGGSHGKHSRETKNRIGSKSFGRKWFNLGKHLSLETRNKISESNLGKNLSEETKRKISIGMSGRVLTRNHRRMISKSREGKTHTEETKKKISKSNQGKHFDNGMKGKHHSEKTKKKMSKSLRKIFHQP